ncbi:hypothetical protein ES705_05333 [subsurface metagenome]
MQRIKLLRSQKILLQMKSQKVQEAITLTQARQKEVTATLNMIITEEHHIPKDELPLWKLAEDGQAIEKIEIPKPKENEEDKENKNKEGGK